MKPAEQYAIYQQSWSDIKAHLPRLYAAAKGNVVELGVRNGISTGALLAGLERHGGYLISVDIDPNCAGLYADHPQWKFVHADSVQAALLIEPKSVDLLFIDTSHTYEHTLAELRAWESRMKLGAKIMLHDTDDGSTYPGVRRAIVEFCGYDKFYWFYPESYGFGEIEC